MVGGATGPIPWTARRDPQQACTLPPRGAPGNYENSADGSWPLEARSYSNPQGEVASGRASGVKICHKNHGMKNHKVLAPPRVPQTRGSRSGGALAGETLPGSDKLATVRGGGRGEGGGGEGGGRGENATEGVAQGAREESGGERT
jgi:hypothetical protein